MRRISPLTTAAIVLSAVAIPASASAKITELGATKTQLVAPTCPPGVTPKKCTIVLTRATALETVRDGVAYPTTVKQAGQIVAFTVGLSRLSANVSTARSDISFLDSTYGGTTRVAVTALAPVGAKSHRTWKVTGESPVVRVQPYLGQVIQIPLLTTLPVARGDVIALTTTTWVPVLSIDVSTKAFAYRQSRTTNCTNPPKTSQAQSVGRKTKYGCNYPGTRVEYSATEITNPVAVSPIHAPFRGAHATRDPLTLGGRSTGGAPL
jgi:hypothetical protein